MAKVKNTFIKSKMNKDLDARIIANNEYRNAVNVQVNKSEGENVGSLENVLGNNVVADIADHTGKSNLYCIGKKGDDFTKTMYLFFTDYTDPNPKNLTYNPSNSSWIISVDFSSSVPVIKTLVTGAFLNFSKTHLIHGINILENLLFWTDNRNQPRKINIDVANPTGLTTPTYYTTEDQISVAKYNPYSAIELFEESRESTAATTQFETTMKDVTSKYYPNGGSAKVESTVSSGDSSFIVKDLKGYIAQAQTPSPYGAGANVSYIDSSGNITPITSAVVDTVTFAAAAGSNPAKWTVTITGTTMPGLSTNTEIIFNYNKYYEKDFAGDDTYLQDKFVRFAYRFKFLDDEYSLFSTFTQSAFVPMQDGYFLYVNDETRGMPEVDDQDEAYRSTIVSFMENKIDKIKLRIPLPFKNFEIKDKLHVENIDILYRESDQTTVKVVETIEDNEIFNQSAECLVKTTTTSDVNVAVTSVNGGVQVGAIVTGFGITTNVTVVSYTPDDPNINPSTSGTIKLSSAQSLTAGVKLTIGEPEYFTYNYQSQKPFKTLPEKDLIRVHDVVPVRALAQEISGNRVIYGNFLNKHTAPDFINYNAAVSAKSEFNSQEASGDAVGPIASGSTTITLTNVKQTIFVGMLVICDGVPEGTLVTNVNGSVITIDTPTTAIIANLQLVLLLPGSDVQSTSSKIEYPNSSLKTNRNYQVGVVLSDRYGRQSGTILSNNTESVAVGSNTFKGDTIYSPYNDETLDIDSWPGNSLKVIFNEVIGETYDPEMALPGVYNSDPTSKSYNPLGWHSFKIVVKQTEQDYYNVYLPGIMSSYPDNQTLEVTETAHTVLISDNINKVPRDLQEVGPQQDLFRASVQLFGRVENSSTDVSVASGNMGLSNKQYYPGNTSDFASTIATVRDLFDYNPQEPPQPNFFPQFYSLESNPYIARINTAKQIGQIANVNFTAVSGFISVASTGGNTTIQLANVSGDTAGLNTGDLVQGGNFPSDLTLVSFTNSSAGPAGRAVAGNATSTEITMVNVVSITAGMQLGVGSGTPTIPDGTIVLSIDGSVLTLNNIVSVTAATDTIDFTVPAQVVVSSPVTQEIGTLVNIYSASNPGIQHLAVYETKPTESLLDIFWETSTTGLVKSVNDIILNENPGGAGAAGLNQFNTDNFKETLISGDNMLSGPVYLVDNFGVQITTGIDTPLSLDGVVDGYGTDVQNGAYDNGAVFAFTETSSGSNEFNLTVSGGFVGNSSFFNPGVQSVWFGEDELLRTFTFTFSAVVNGLAFSQTQTATLGNEQPHILTGTSATCKVLIPPTSATTISVYSASSALSGTGTGQTVTGTSVATSTVTAGTAFTAAGTFGTPLPLTTGVYQSTTATFWGYTDALLIVGNELNSSGNSFQTSDGPLWTPPGTYIVSKTTDADGNIVVTFNNAISFLPSDPNSGAGLSFRGPATLEVNNAQTLAYDTVLTVEALDLWDDCSTPQVIYPINEFDSGFSLFPGAGGPGATGATGLRKVGTLSAVNGAGWSSTSAASGNINAFRDLTFEILSQTDSSGAEVDHFILENQSFNLARQATIDIINKDNEDPNFQADIYTINYRVSDPADFVDCSVKINYGLVVSEVQQWKLTGNWRNCNSGGDNGIPYEGRFITLKVDQPGGGLLGDNINGYWGYQLGTTDPGEFPSWNHAIANNPANNIILGPGSSYNTGCYPWIHAYILRPSGQVGGSATPCIYGGTTHCGLLFEMKINGPLLDCNDPDTSTGCLAYNGSNSASWSLEAGFGTNTPISPSPDTYIFTYQE